MSDSFKAGQTIRCTILSDIRREDALQTVTRLMRLSPQIKKGLKKAQEHRVRTLIVRSRGKRPWEVRQRASTIAKPIKGATWTMRFFPHIGPDIASVSRYLKVEAA